MRQVNFLYPCSLLFLNKCVIFCIDVFLLTSSPHTVHLFCIGLCSVLQLPILASSIVSLYFLELTDIFQPVHSGYSCNDRSLSLPYILPRQEVCPLPLLFSLAFAAPTVTVSTSPHVQLSHWLAQ